MENTDREALAFLARQAVEAAGTQVVALPLLEKVIVRTGDTAEMHDIPPRRRSATLHGLADLISFVKDGEICKAPEVYHEGFESDRQPNMARDHGAIRVLCDRAVRRDVAQLPLTLGDSFLQLLALATQPGKSIKEVVNMLRFNISGAEAAELSAKLGKIDFKRNEQSGQAAKHGRESLGRSVEMEAVGAVAIPETADFTVPMYTNDTTIRELSIVTIKCGVFIDIIGEKVEIRPLAEEIDVARSIVQLKLGNYLREQLGAVPVFNGRPMPVGAEANAEVAAHNTVRAVGSKGCG